MRLGPVVDFLRRRSPDARLAVRPTPAWRPRRPEAGPDVELLPADFDACVDAIADVSNRA